MSHNELPVPRYELAFSSGEDSLSVREFKVKEGLSRPFEVEILARSKNHDVDLEALVGAGAAFRMRAGIAPGLTETRSWNGVCSHAELDRVEPEGNSTYRLVIRPALWELTLRENCRIFQHEKIPAIVKKIFDEWQIEARFDLKASYPAYEYRVQYGETDFAFVSRLLEEAGITYYFVSEPPKEGAEWTAENETKLVLTDRPEAAPARAPVTFVDHLNQDIRQEYATAVKVLNDVRPGQATVRSWNQRFKPDQVILETEKDPQRKLDGKHERYTYEAQAFLFEPGTADNTPVADDRGIARVDAKLGKALVKRRLESHRVGRRRVTFRSNVLELTPGTIFSLSAHPRSDLAEDKKLLVVSSYLEGDHIAWKYSGEAFYKDDPYVPPQTTKRPRILGIQSAIVCGPKGEEIHTDEFGRVRVQFHWDREHAFDDQSSCWIRVSQAWAGSAYGMITIPRVGQEVLVEFFDGDPDQPVVSGRVFNATNPVPFKLPEHKTQSGWKSDSSQGSRGFNMIRFEDKKGQEHIEIQAQKDYVELIKNNQSSTVLANRTTNVGAHEGTKIGASSDLDVGNDRSIRVKHDNFLHVGNNRWAHVGQDDVVHAMRSHTHVVDDGTGINITRQRIVFTTGSASIVLQGGAIFLDATAGIQLTGGVVRADSTSGNVELNCGAASILGLPVGASVAPVRLDPATAPEPARGPSGGGATSEPAYVLAPQKLEITQPGTFPPAELGPPPVVDVLEDAVDEAVEKATDVLPLAQVQPEAKNLTALERAAKGVGDTLKEAVGLGPDGLDGRKLVSTIREIESNKKEFTKALEEKLVGSAAEGLLGEKAKEHLGEKAVEIAKQAIRDPKGAKKALETELLAHGAEKLVGALPAGTPGAAPTDPVGKALNGAVDVVKENLGFGKDGFDGHKLVDTVREAKADEKAFKKGLEQELLDGAVQGALGDSKNETAQKVVEIAKTAVADPKGAKKALEDEALAVAVEEAFKKATAKPPAPTVPATPAIPGAPSTPSVPGATPGTPDPSGGG